MRAATKRDDPWSALEELLEGETRQAVVDELSSAKTLGAALHRLRRAIEADSFSVGQREFSLRGLVRRAEARAGSDGFHVLHDWDGPAKRFQATTIPLDVLDHLATVRGEAPAAPLPVALLLDYYLLYVLALLALAACSQDDADEELDRLGRLLDRLQGPSGSGQRFADDVGTLVLLATSHYEPEERGFLLLLDRARRLARRHRLSLALVHATSLGAHLRFGFDVTYGRDTVAMREDNGADYPWLCFALATLAEEYAAHRTTGEDAIDRDRIVEALLSGLSPDPRAFVGEPPASLAPCRTEWLAFREVFETYRQDLIEEFAREDPAGRPYSPLALSYNFAQNVVKGAVVDALLRGEAWPISLNGLLTRFRSEDEALARRRALAETLAGYAQRHPDWIRGAWRPVILYDLRAGRRAFRLAMEKLQER